jgi:transposase
VKASDEEMSYLRGPDRAEVQLLPACLDDYVSAEAPARFIEAYVESLDFAALGFTRACTKATGRPPYHPADLLKLYLYGYLQGIRSSRKLEAEAGRNLELIWLLRGVKPDFKTIADFRKDNRAAFKPLFKNFNLLCRRMDLFGAELVAIDGSKFKAVNGKGRHFMDSRLIELLARVESRIEEYLQQLDNRDKEAQGVADPPTRQALAEKIAQLKERREHYQALQQGLQENGESQVSLTDPDSRKMKGPHGQHVIGYNVQVAVDDRHKLIVAQEVVQSGSDRGELAEMARAAKEELKVDRLRVVADKGYHDVDQLESCERAGIEAFVSEQGTTSGRSRNHQPVFPKEQFHYDATAQVYHCPAGQILYRNKPSRSHGKDRILFTNPGACRQCPQKNLCTTAKFRMIARRAHEEAAERTAERVVASPELLARRKEIVEHVFGTLRNWHHDRFLMRRLGKARAEFSLSAMVYNLRRVINLVSLNKLTAAL